MNTAAKKSRKSNSISDLTINRLSLYLRCLHRLREERVEAISSQRLAEIFQLNSAQIRKDLASFGEFGVRGVGYYVDDLIAHVTRILGLDRTFPVAIVGAGHLGKALADYGRFSGEGFSVVALFDTSPVKIGRKTRRGVPIHGVSKMKRVVALEKIKIAILAVPADAAQDVTDRLIACGITAILNFTPVNLRVPDHVKLNNVDLTIQMESMAFFLTHPEYQSRTPGLRRDDRRQRSASARRGTR